jgi:5'(3')-deoxyribonucleotidase
MKTIVGIDMDGVLCDLLSKWLQAYNKDYDDALTIDEFAIDFGGDT